MSKFGVLSNRRGIKICNVYLKITDLIYGPAPTIPHVVIKNAWVVKVNLKKQSQRGFVAVTLLTVLSIATVLVVYAALLGLFPGGEVTVGGVEGAQIQYSLNNANETGPWTTTLNPGAVGTPWFARMNITAGDYSGPVTITWQLQWKNGTGGWEDVSTSETTSVALTGAVGQIVYASNNGTFVAGNHNWADHVSTAGTYRVYATVDSA